MLTEEEVRAALRDCYDPEIPCNIVDLGLLQAIEITDDPEAPGRGIPGVPQKHRVTVALRLSNPTEDTEAQLSAQIANRLAGLETVSQTSIRILSTPQWTPQDITARGRRTLGLDGNPTLVQIR